MYIEAASNALVSVSVTAKSRCRLHKLSTCPNYEWRVVMGEIVSGIRRRMLSGSVILKKERKSRYGMYYIKQDTAELKEVQTLNGDLGHFRGWLACKS
jgi:hypothetical protein